MLTLRPGFMQYLAVRVGHIAMQRSAARRACRMAPTIFRWKSDGGRSAERA